MGPMGAGKTTVGERAAERLGRPFVDTDDLITATTGATVSELFAARGEDGFRSLERVAVADAVAAPVASVISCGGGAVLDADNRAALAGAGYVVWLDADASVLAGRVEGGERPLLATGDPVATLEGIRVLRSDAYDAVADVRIDTEGLEPDEVTDEVVAAYEAAP